MKGLIVVVLILVYTRILGESSIILYKKLMSATRDCSCA